MHASADVGDSLCYYATAEDLSRALAYVECLHSKYIEDLEHSSVKNTEDADGGMDAAEEDLDKYVDHIIEGIGRELEIQSHESDREIRFHGCLCSRAHC